ncbi:MAG: MerR family transcriptional regulator [Chitinophagales bacterium]|nr:MerR family transcriptional regulator [Chitinophagales bacterium]
MEEENQKHYYSIGEVSELLNVPPSTLRYWEKEFDILKPKKNAKGDRLFTRSDLQNIKLIYLLVKEKGYTIDGAKAQLKNKLSAEQKKLQIVERLKHVRSFLADIKEAL